MLRKRQHDDELKDKGHVENHSQSKYSIFSIISLIDTTKYYWQIFYENYWQILNDKSFMNPVFKTFRGKTCPIFIQWIK